TLTGSAASPPTGGGGTASSTTAINWNWTVAAGSGNTYKVYDASTAGNLKATSATDANNVTESGLSVNTQYTRFVSTTNGGCESASRLALPAKYTLANAPTSIAVTNVSSTSQSVTFNVNSNPASTQFAIQDSVSGKWVQADGTLGAAAVLQTQAQWGGTAPSVTKAVMGLTADTNYQFQAQARNGDNITTGVNVATAL